MQISERTARCEEIMIVDDSVSMRQMVGYTHCGKADLK
jgi:hypothetical protein